jgi:hypothetical protein
MVDLPLANLHTFKENDKVIPLGTVLQNIHVNLSGSDQSTLEIELLRSLALFR